MTTTPTVHADHEAEASCAVCRCLVHQYPFGWAHVNGDGVLIAGKHDPQPVNVRCSCEATR